MLKTAKYQQSVSRSPSQLQWGNPILILQSELPRPDVRRNNPPLISRMRGTTEYPIDGILNALIPPYDIFHYMVRFYSIPFQSILLFTNLNRKRLLKDVWLNTTVIQFSYLKMIICDLFLNGSKFNLLFLSKTPLFELKVIVVYVQMVRILKTK